MTISCSTTQTSMIVADTYDQDKDITTLTLVPYGNIDIPGQWTKTKYNEVSKQHFFIDKDSTSMAVTKNPHEKYPFYKQNLTDQEFAREFFNWEKDYYKKQGFEIDEITSGDNFVIWTAKGTNANSIFLYGSKDKFAYNFAIFTDNWTKEKQIEFLRELFDEN